MDKSVIESRIGGKIAVTTGDQETCFDSWDAWTAATQIAILHQEIARLRGELKIYMERCGSCEEEIEGLRNKTHSDLGQGLASYGSEIIRLRAENEQLRAQCVIWRKVPDLPEVDDSPAGRSRKLLVIMPKEWRHKGENPIRFGYYFARLHEWQIEGSPSSWPIEWWAELPVNPEDK